MGHLGGVDSYSTEALAMLLSVTAMLGRKLET